MAEGPEGMHIFVVKPRSYEEIIERSQKTPKPYTEEDLRAMEAKARAQNNVVYVMFMDPDFWANGRKSE